MIKLMVSDLDGTLLDSRHRLDPLFFDLYEKLKSKGITFAIATGRQYLNTLSFFETLPCIPLITENGAYLKYHNEDLVLEYIPKKLVEKTINLCKDIPDTAVFLCRKEGAFISRKQLTPKIEEINKAYNVVCTVVDELTFSSMDFYKITVGDTIDARANSYPLIKKALGNELMIFASGATFIDMTNKGVTKGTAIEALQKHLNISKEETAVFGDNDNDVPMTDYADFSYAMATSSPGMVKACKYRALSNDEGGVLRIMEKVLEGEIG